MIGADPFDQIERMLLSGEHDSPTARLGDIASLSEHHKTLIEAETAIATSLPLQSVLSQVEDTIAALENSAAPNGQDILMARLQIVRAVALASTGRQAAARSILLDLQQAASPSAAIRYRLMRELGRLCMERGDLDEALALFVRALVVARAEEDSFRQEIVLFDIARGYQNRGRNNTALDILGGLRAAFPSSTVIGARLATYSARSRLNLKQYDSAFEDIEPAIGFYASKAPTSITSGRLLLLPT
ncbi:MAG: tetratricopeptide repeat protein, partial [Alphaproteobacteria bacterium]